MPDWNANERGPGEFDLLFLGPAALLLRFMQAAHRDRKFLLNGGNRPVDPVSLFVTE